MADESFDSAEVSGPHRAQARTVLELYRDSLERRGFAADDSQYAAVQRLQRLYEQWHAYKARRNSALKRLVVRPPLPRGIYLWGGVGRGKSFLMDSFFRCVPLVRKRRVHFHHFMRDVHRELEELKGTEDPLDALAGRIARRHRLICFDEMHVSDIADAMILGRLLARTMGRGVVYCMTSNVRPDDLYRDGLKRENFLPAIALIRDRMDVVEVDGGVDYRRRAMADLRLYHAPCGPQADRELARAFERIADVAEEGRRVEIEGRAIACRHRAGGVVWFDFATLCGWGRSQNDYLEIARRFHTVIVSGVPRLGVERADEARRFTLLVDVFYDSGVKMIVSADAPPERLLEVATGVRDARLRAMVFQFERTASRLLEMQTVGYLSRGHGGTA